MEQGIRAFLDVLRQHGQLRVINVPVDWELEVGAILHEVNRRKGPAILFDRVKDYRIPLLAGALSTTPRIALALGLPPDTPSLAIIKTYKERVKKGLPPLVVQGAPCKERIRYRDEIDLFEFPSPLWHELDGGRYLGTLHAVMCRDPNTGWQNAGVHRLMLHDKKTLGVYFAPGQHNALICSHYHGKGRSMPVAVAIGLDPVCIMVSAAGFPAFTDEWAAAGGLRENPLKVVKCETSDILVPADAEIVIEGEIPVDEKRDEGPFGEHPGYFGGGRVPRPIINVHCVTHRSDPIFQGTYEGMPPNEDHVITSINQAVLAWKAFEDIGFYGINGIHFPPGADPWLSAIISIEKRYEGQGIDASRILLGCKAGSFVKHVVIVDEDIDIFNLEQVLWAINTRFQAGRMIVTHSEHGSTLDPSKPLSWGGVTDRMVIDATWPMTHDFPPRTEWGGMRHPPVLKPSTPLLEKVINRWDEYGIE